MRRWLLGLLLCVAIPCANAADALPTIDECLTRLDTATDIGYARIAARCPDLASALLHSPAAAWLPADWNQPDNDLSVFGLEDLRALLVRQSIPSAALRPRLNTAHVATVLAGVVQTETLRASWWTRFKEWLRRIFAPRAQAPEDSLLRRWLTGMDLSQGMRDAIGWIALGLVVLIAASVILNELRIAGMLGGRERGGRPRATGAAPAQNTISLDEIERAEAAAQPGLLLELIAARLVAQDRLPAARALTAREVWRRAHLPEARARSSLDELVSVCERVRFSAAQVPRESLQAALAAGRSVLALLDRDSFAAPGAA